MIKPGTVINDIVSHEDMLPTFLAAAGDATAKEDLKKGRTVGGTNYKVHIDGYDLGPALKGQAAWPRKEFIYWTDDGSVAALRYDEWKMVFLEQRGHGFDVWQEPFVKLRLPKLFNLRPTRSSGRTTKAWAMPPGALIACSSWRPPALCGPVAAKLQGVPAAPEARFVQPRPRDGGSEQASQQLTPRSRQIERG